MDPEIKKLIELTTIIKVYDNVSRQTIFGDEFYISRFQKNQWQQIDLNKLEQNWENKWRSFGNLWNRDHQNYIFLYDCFRLFYFSFEQLRFNKIRCINEVLGDKFKMLHFNELSGVSLYGMYHHGKKCIDLLKELRLITEKHSDWNFCKRFSETRNKLMEHNFNPHGLSFQIEPFIWSLASTNSLMKIGIHRIEERIYDAYIDYYEDYYQLEKIITNIIKDFKYTLRNF